LQGQLVLEVFAVGVHRFGAELEVKGDFPGCAARAQKLEDLQFAVGQQSQSRGFGGGIGEEIRQQPGRGRTTEIDLAAQNGLDGTENQLARLRLGKIAPSAGSQGPVGAGPLVILREYDDPASGVGRGEFAGQVLAIAVAQAAVHQDDLRLEDGHGPARLGHRAGRSAADQGGLLINPMLEALAKKRVIINHKHARFTLGWNPGLRHACSAAR
jgi:hypothetical protein